MKTKTYIVIVRNGYGIQKECWQNLTKRQALTRFCQILANPNPAEYGDNIHIYNKTNRKCYAVARAEELGTWEYISIC